MTALKDFTDCVASVVLITALIFVLASAVGTLNFLREDMRNTRAEFTLSQGSIFIRDPKGIDYIDFKVTSVWTVCQKCHFDSVAWHKHREERGI